MYLSTKIVLYGVGFKCLFSNKFVCQEVSIYFSRHLIEFLC